MLKTIASLAFLAAALAGGLYTAQHVNYDSGKIFLYFLAPYYVVATALQYVFPQQRNDFERSEVWTDVLHNGGLVAISSVQTFMIHALTAFAAPGLLVHYGILAPEHALSHQPFWLQVVVSMLLFDFCFYWTHRLAHEVDFLWRFHSVHHCAHRLSVLNASRAHPIDMIWRRIVPIFIVLQTGISQEAFIVAGMVGSILATITHMNVDFRFGLLNYVIGSNEVHRWHHSNKIEEAKNFCIWVIWDQLFGTFVYPRDGRRGPAKMGLFNELYYPVHSFWRQMLIPFTWKAWKRRQAGGTAPAPAPSAEPAAQPGEAIAGAR
ncbi:MAG: sterol desaturase family protein [Aquabacterium sp.]|nr:MAG: sterol desaturase family protein [Aquabacterium sp.]